VGALVEQGRAFHVAYTSSNMAGIRAVVLSALKISAMARSSMTVGMRTLGGKQDFPALPKLRVRLMTSPQNRSEMAQQLESLSDRAATASSLAFRRRRAAHRRLGVSQAQRNRDRSTAAPSAPARCAGPRGPGHARLHAAPHGRVT
jgi:hypothetical protein